MYQLIDAEMNPSARKSEENNVRSCVLSLV
jgi:hypothetical protein